MPTFELYEVHKWTKVTSPDAGTVEVQLCPMSHLETITYAEMMGRKSTEVFEQKDVDTGRTSSVRTTETPAEGHVTEATRFKLERCVSDWRDVKNPRGDAIPFTFDALDRLMGLYPEWGKALHREIDKINKAAEKPADPPKAGESGPA